MPTQTAPTAPAATQTLDELIQHILDTHHAYLRSELPFFEERIAKMCANHGRERPDFFVVQQTLQDLRDDLMAHLAKEEQVLFPYIRRLEAARRDHLPAPESCFPSVRFPIRMMLTEHDGATALVAGLRRITENYTPPDFVCDNGRAFYTRLEHLEADLAEHIRVENDVLFPRAIALEESGR